MCRYLLTMLRQEGWEDVRYVHHPNMNKREDFSPHQHTSVDRWSPSVCFFSGTFRETFRGDPDDYPVVVDLFRSVSATLLDVFPVFLTRSILKTGKGRRDVEFDCLLSLDSFFPLLPPQGLNNTSTNNDSVFDHIELPMSRHSGHRNPRIVTKTSPVE